MLSGGAHLPEPSAVAAQVSSDRKLELKLELGIEPRQSDWEHEHPSWNCNHVVKCLQQDSGFEAHCHVRNSDSAPGELEWISCTPAQVQRRLSMSKTNKQKHSVGKCWQSLPAVS